MVLKGYVKSIYTSLKERKRWHGVRISHIGWEITETLIDFNDKNIFLPLRRITWLDCAIVRSEWWFTVEHNTAVESWGSYNGEISFQLP